MNKSHYSQNKFDNILSNKDGGNIVGFNQQFTDE